ncbi:MAG TPA: preprotein translocase subunit SecG [Acholeplasmataceae bacterium]|nr:preprotein translocase subunit SecG [Acholeplasmataceae bacterium]
MQFPDWIIFVASILMIAISALQSSKDDVMSAFTGNNTELFRNKKVQGPDVFFNRAMIILGILFFAMIIWSNNIDRFFM